MRPSQTINFAPPSSDNITRVPFDNGLTLLIYESHSVESVVIYGSLRAGSIYEDATHNGLASMTASALMRGTRKRDFDTLHSELEDIGADLSIGSGKFTVSFGGRALAEDLGVLLDILSDALRNPAFPADEIALMRQQRLTELQYSQQDIRFRASRSFSEKLYPADHVYHYTSYGSLKTLSKIQDEDLRAFHARHYGPRGMIVAIAGAISTTEAIEQVQAAFADWQNADQPDEPALPALQLTQTMQRSHIRIPGKSQSSIVMGSFGPSTTSPAFQAARLANSILGEFAMMGRIGQVIREDLGLAYYAYSRIEGGQGPGPWNLSIGVAPENVDLTIEKALEEVKRLTSEPVDPEDLADNQSYFAGRLPLRLESIGGIATQLQAMERYGFGLDYLKNYHEMIYSLTPEDLLAAAREFLNPDALIISVAGPNEA